MKKNNKSNIKEKDNNKINKILKNNINEKKLIKIKNNKRIEREPSQKINKNKKENILKNINNNKNIGDYSGGPSKSLEKYLQICNEISEKDENIKDQMTKIYKEAVQMEYDFWEDACK